MKLWPGCHYPAVMALFFGSAVMARADLVHWSYQWDRTPLAIGAGTGGIGLTNEPLTHAIGSSDIVATNLSVFSVADPSTPDHLSGGAYSLKLTITDDASHAQGTFTFAGQLDGTISSGSAAVTNTFTSATTLPAQTIGGSNSYTVTIGPFSAPGPPSSLNTGAIGAHVEVQGGSVRTQNNPEPSTLLLAGLGLALLVLGTWKSRRRSTALVNVSV